MAFTATQKQVLATIGKVNGLTLRTAIQAAAMAVIGHAMENGSSPLADAFLARFDTSQMMGKLVPAVSDFLVKRGPFVFGDKGWQLSKAKRDALLELGYDFDTYCLDVPFWDEKAKTPPKDKTVDLIKELEKLVARARKADEEGICLDDGMIDVINAAMGAYIGRKVLAEASAKAASTAPSKEEAAFDAGRAEYVEAKRQVNIARDAAEYEARKAKKVTPAGTLVSA